jgi:hypothetical protein
MISFDVLFIEATIDVAVVSLTDVGQSNRFCIGVGVGELHTREEKMSSCMIMNRWVAASEVLLS